MDDQNGAKAEILVRVFDGTRRLISTDVQMLITLVDGYGNHSPGFYQTIPEVLIAVAFYNNLQDSYTVIVSVKGYKDGGYRPAKVSLTQQQVVDVMLLPKAATLRFRDSDWAKLQQNQPALSKVFAQGLTNADAEARYDQLVNQRPAALAGLMNITVAMSQIVFSAGKSALDYFKEMIWDPSPAQDRFFAYANADLIDQVKQAAAAGKFAEEPHPGTFHPGATLSYKQVELAEAIVQLTFHEGDARTIEGVACVKVEPDIDYYKDLVEHGLFEVLPNTIIHGLTDPEKVYELRWIAARKEGTTFDPPYTIEALWS
jgi:hypothetical protein